MSKCSVNDCERAALQPTNLCASHLRAWANKLGRDIAMTDSAYILDGIPTAMEYYEIGTFECPCGWKQSAPQGTWGVHDAGQVENRAALRFHFAHCTQARIPGVSRETDGE